jgi:hypothetical protein
MNFVKPESVENKYNLTSTSKQFPPPQHSGRIPNFNDPSLQTTKQFSLYDVRSTLDSNDTRQELIGHMHSETPLNKTFFSQANIDLLQSKIQQQVSQMSGGKFLIDKQSDDDLKLIMRSYYLMFGRNNPATISSDLQDLNARVIGYSAAKVYSEVDFYMFYRKDIENFASPIANPMNVHVYGTRYGELKSFF